MKSDLILNRWFPGCFGDILIFDTPLLVWQNITEFGNIKQYFQWISKEIQCNCAKRSFHPCCTSNSDVLRPSVLREIIDFCEGEQKAASLLLSTGGLHDWFWRIQKWTALKCFKEWYRPVQGPFFDTALEAFLQDVCKTMTLQIRPDTAPLGSFHRCGVILRRPSAGCTSF